MNKRAWILIWPLLLAPFAAVATVMISGPAYTTAPEQDVMVARLLGVIVWLVIACAGCVGTIMASKSKKKTELFLAILAAAGSILVFHAMVTWIR